MIFGYRDNWFQQYFVDDVHSRHVPTEIEARLLRKLQMIDDATSDQDLRACRRAILLRSSAEN
jgi:toxin HigB-1